MDEAAPPTVERIAHYRILRRIGRGGMGVVYRAIDERDGRTVALKVIRGSETSDEDAGRVNEARRRFTREAEILRSLLHVNVVAFTEIGEHDGVPYLAMEFLAGVPIGSYAGRPYTESLPLLVQAAHGLAYLASRGIVHRDLSPDNIYVVEKEGERIVKLLDFGVAKMFEMPTGLDALTETGFFLGKVAYGSPEQLGYLGHGTPLDWRSDVYSLGLIFYEVLSGRRAFEGKTPVEIIAANLNQAALPAAAPPGMPQLPIPLVRLVARMLEKRRENRPHGYREIVDQLVAVLRDAGRPLPAQDPVPDPDVRPITGETALLGRKITEERSTLWLRSLGRPLASPLARAATGVVLLGAALGVIVLWHLRAPDPRRTAGGPAAQTVVPAAPSPVTAAAETSAGGPERTGAEAPVLAESSGSGALQLVATPFASVVSLTDPSGRPIALPNETFTPCVFSPLAPGVYRVVLECPAANRRRLTREVTVGAERPTLLAVSFLTPAELVESLR